MRPVMLHSQRHRIRQKFLNRSWRHDLEPLRIHAIHNFQEEDGIRDYTVTGVQTCALPISMPRCWPMPRLAATIASHNLRGIAFLLDCVNVTCYVQPNRTDRLLAGGGARLLRRR